jgi:NADH dehydrogenase
MPNTTSAPAGAVLSWAVRVVSVCVVVTRAPCHPADRAASSNRDEAVWPNSVHHHRIAANAPQRSRVVIVGAGFGGLFAARFLRRAPVDVTVVDKTNHHLFQPLLYQVATGILSEGAIAPATRDVLRRHRNVSVLMAEVTGFDLEAREVHCRQPDGRPLTLPYDSLVVAAGAGGSYFGHDEFAEWAPGMKTLDDAVRHRTRILGALEMAELETDDDVRAAWLTFVIVGGGPTGVEIAGQIAELGRRAIGHSFTRFGPNDVRVILCDGGKEILATFGDRLSQHATQGLERTGVEIRTEAIVQNVDATGVEVRSADGSTTKIASRTVIWAAGVAASPLARMLADASGAECDRAGRIAVQPDCSLPGRPEVFAVGDMMSLNGLPGVAEVAMQSGIHAARTISGRLKGEQAKPFKYRDLGSMATISRRRAIVSFRGIRLHGYLGWLAWLMVHITFMTGFKNRFAALMSWSFAFLGHSRPQQVIDEQRMPGRAEPAAPGEAAAVVDARTAPR